MVSGRNACLSAQAAYFSLFEVSGFKYQVSLLEEVGFELVEVGSEGVVLRANPGCGIHGCVGGSFFRAAVLCFLRTVENLYVLRDDLRFAAHLPVFLPCARLQFAFYVEFHPLADILLRPFGEVAPKDDGMPVGSVGDLRSVLHGVSPFGGCKIEVGDGNATIEVAYFGVSAYVANKNDFVY